MTEESLPYATTAFREGQVMRGHALPVFEVLPVLSLEEQQELLALLNGTWAAVRLLELVRHGWGDLHIIVNEHTILKSHMTKTDK